MQQLDDVLTDFERRTKTLLMIDGGAIDMVMSDAEVEKRFFTAATHALVLLIHRCRFFCAKQTERVQTWIEVFVGSFKRQS